MYPVKPVCTQSLPAPSDAQVLTAHACTASWLANSLSDQCAIPENLHVARRITHSLDAKHGIQIGVRLPWAIFNFQPDAGSASSRLMTTWGTRVLLGLFSTSVTILYTFTVKPDPHSSHRADDLTTTQQRLSNDQWAVPSVPRTAPGAQVASSRDASSSLARAECFPEAAITNVKIRIGQERTQQSPWSDRHNWPVSEPADSSERDQGKGKLWKDVKMCTRTWCLYTLPNWHQGGRSGARSIIYMQLCNRMSFSQFMQDPHKWGDAVAACQSVKWRRLCHLCALTTSPWRKLLGNRNEETVLGTNATFASRK